MQSQLKIKVIKKNAVEIRKTPKVAQKIKEENEKQGVMREVVSTVSDWINEFQQRRREETKQSFEHLFAQNLQAK